MDIDRRELRVALARSSTAVAFELKGAVRDNSRPAGWRLANISRTGMFVEAPVGAEHLACGSEVHFALRFDDDVEVAGVGKVRWIRKEDLGPYQRPGFGVQVVEFQDAAERHYLEFLEARLLNLKITDLMESNCVTLPPSATVKEAADAIVRRKVHAAVVVDGEEAPLGVFGQMELARVVGRGASLLDTVGLHMVPGPQTLDVEQDIDAAYELMRHGAIGHFPVLEDGMVVGMLSTGDLLRHWSEFMELQTRRLTRSYDKAMGVIAHDLRTPISVIASTNALLTSGQLTPQDYVESGFPQSLDRSCETMLRLIDDILDISGLHQGVVRLERRAVDIEALIAHVMRIFIPTAEGKGIDLKVAINTDLPKVYADPARLEQVLSNLVSNAIKFSPAGSRVVIGAQPNHSRMMIWVTDNGPGIAPLEQGRLFKEFGRTSNRPTGGEKSIGLGLAITRRLIEAHHGEITVESRPGLGSTFTISLPLEAIQ